MKKKILSATTAVIALMALSACAPSVPSVPSTEETTSVAAPTEIAIATKEITTITGLKIPVKGIQNDGKGEYLQTTISDSDPVMTVDQSVVEPTATGQWSPAEISDANKMVIKFIAEEAIDSTLSGGNPDDKANTQKWIDTHSPLFAPNQKASLIADVWDNDPNKPIVFRGQFRDEKYGLVHGKDVTHVADRKIKVNRIVGGSLDDGTKAIGVEADVQFSLNTDFQPSAGKLSDTGKSAAVVESTNATISYTLVKGAKGEWLISGFYSTFTTVPVVE